MGIICPHDLNRVNLSVKDWRGPGLHCQCSNKSLPSSKILKKICKYHLNLSFVKEIYVDGKKLAINGWKLAIYNFVNTQGQKNLFAFCVITIETIEVQTRSAPQNDPLNLSFVKDTRVVVKKWSEMGGRVEAVSIDDDPCITCLKSLWHSYRTWSSGPNLCISLSNIVTQ